ncbi:uncharacterized protein K460DRAFT_109736 [Cucurbitaria berberidis CBS 394.84]|uniref:Uncharacterized protein n=1 Tax=Cucurbitaria berberidis CBS 394.84 TaxID=1168544 RepID=A0A9P4GH56_9PLEO|nr:uncharacterized protein K460DRAFT_109736 [Cucurbitaria berberidis CBS 394.84]KAF1845475.1 hypothetical protein K460DRAFT_109736 [Cucurbitaria berberidis CBS 394.84]
MINAFEYFRSTPSQRPSAANASPRRIYVCPPNVAYNSSKDVTKRISFDTLTITIYGWPSRGGLITLEDASPADLDFLDLDRRNPGMLRHERREEEDAFCQKLLLLGAKWWDSNARYSLLNSPDVNIVELDESYEPLPTMRERHWISVAWPTTGGLVVSEFGTNMWGVEIEVEVVPSDVARLRLCVSMDEKAHVLKERFQGKTWSSVEDYEGNAFIGCWGLKKTGEVGEFQEVWPEN